MSRTCTKCKENKDLEFKTEFKTKFGDYARAREYIVNLWLLHSAAGIYYNVSEDLNKLDKPYEKTNY